MGNPIRTSIRAFLIIGILVMSSLTIASFSKADDSNSERVPEPWITEQHEYNKQETYQGTARENFDNEVWGIHIIQGNVGTLLTARNYTTNNGETFVDYSQNINFYIGGKFYISMFTIDHVVLTILGQKLITPLKTCDHFEVTYKPIKYDGMIPTMDCNITFKGIHVYTDRPGDSYFDLTLLHHFRGDWNQSSIKVEALFDFSRTEFFNGTNPPIGEPFTAEIRYVMELTDPDIKNGDNVVKPTRFTNETLEYNLTLDNGIPYILTKLDMKDNFTIYNGSGAHSAVGYSYMQMPVRNPNGDQWMYNMNAAIVTHGFPNLTYGDTQSIKSDPEITVFHDKVTANVNYVLIVGAIVAVIVVAVIGSVDIIRKRKKSKQGKIGNDSDKQKEA